MEVEFPLGYPLPRKDRFSILLHEKLAPFVEPIIKAGVFEDEKWPERLDISRSEALTLLTQCRLEDDPEPIAVPFKYSAIGSLRAELVFDLQPLPAGLDYLPYHYRLLYSVNHPNPQFKAELIEKCGDLAELALKSLREELIPLKEIDQELLVILDRPVKDDAFWLELARDCKRRMLNPGK